LAEAIKAKKVVEEEVARLGEESKSIHAIQESKTNDLSESAAKFEQVNKELAELRATTTQQLMEKDDQLKKQKKGVESAEAKFRRDIETLQQVHEGKLALKDSEFQKKEGSMRLLLDGSEEEKNQLLQRIHGLEQIVHKQGEDLVRASSVASENVSLRATMKSLSLSRYAMDNERVSRFVGGWSIDRS